jgi:hypothetical protein
MSSILWRTQELMRWHLWIWLLMVMKEPVP